MGKAKLSTGAKNRMFRQTLKAVESLEKRLQNCKPEEFETVKRQLAEERKLLSHWAKS